MLLLVFQLGAAIWLGLSNLAVGENTLLVREYAHECNTSVEGYTWNFDSATDEVILESPSVQACFESCAAKPDCQGYTWTYADIINNCYLFKQLYGVHKCNSCSSGVLPQQIEGSCVETDAEILGHGPAESLVECIHLCAETDDCFAYTWFNDTTTFPNTCFLFEKCETTLPCYGCASGAINCFSTQPKQCTDYNVLDEYDRIYTYGGCQYNGGDACFSDIQGYSYTSPNWQGSGYYRFMGPAGNQMIDHAPGMYHCGSTYTGWMTGGPHPDEIGVEVDRTVCFDHDIGHELNCWMQANITVTKCSGGYFVYKLPETRDRYCGINY